MKVLVAVRSCQYDRDLGCHKAIRETWGKYLPECVDIRFFIGGAGAVPNEEDEICLSVDDGFADGALWLKLMKMFDVVLEWDYDFIFLCDTDVYITPAMWTITGFEKYDYSGDSCGIMVDGLSIEGEFGQRYPDPFAGSDKFSLDPFYTFVGGGGRFLSKRAIEFLVTQDNSYGELSEQLPEDLWIGQMLGPLIERGRMTGAVLSYFYNHTFFHVQATHNFNIRCNPANVVREAHDLISTSILWGRR